MQVPNFSRPILDNRPIKSTLTYIDSELHLTKTKKKKRVKIIPNQGFPQELAYQECQERHLNKINKSHERIRYENGNIYKNGITEDKINKIMWKESDWQIAIIIIEITGKQY